LAISDLKAIGASFSQLITATMVSRLVLNIRMSQSDSPPEEFPGPMRFMDRTIGNLGEELETIPHHNSSCRKPYTQDIPLRDYGK